MADNFKNFKRKVLKNGMTVVFEKRYLPVVSMGYGIKHGGINETLNEKGISHFIEHMLYKGTPTRTFKDISEQIENVGGIMNGFTDDELTAFWCKLPSKHLFEGLNVLTDIVKNPLFDKKELEKERKVILEEIKMYHDSPKEHVLTEIMTHLYDGSFSIPLIGTKETLNSMTRDDLLDKFNKVFTPNNMFFSIVGDADFDKICEYLEKSFDKLKYSQFKLKPQKIGLINKKETEKRAGIHQATLAFGYHSPIASDKKNYAAKILNTLMAGGASSRLFQEIREKRNLAYAVGGRTGIDKDFGCTVVFVGTTPESVKKVENLIVKEFKDVAENLTEKELNINKEKMIGRYQLVKESSEGWMTQLLYAENIGDVKELYNFEKNVKEIKLDDVKQMAKNAANKYSFFALVPE